MTAVLERQAGTTLWHQIAAQLEAGIQGGTLKAGQRLPTEHELAIQFGVNRHTVRRAVAELAEKGLVSVERGRGTFVHESVVYYPVKRRTRFTEYMHAQRKEPSGEVVRDATLPADAAVAEALGIRKGSPVILIERLNHSDGRPLNIATHYFPKARCPNLVALHDETGSITQALIRSGIPDYQRKITKVTARMAQAGDARLLGQPPNRPVLVTESVNVDPEGRPTEYCQTRWASDRVQLIVEPEA